MYTRTFDTPKAIGAPKGCKDHWVIYDSPGEMVRSIPADTLSRRFNTDGGSWLGHLTADQARQYAIAGRLDKVGASTKLMDKLEGLSVLAPTSITVDDVAGGVPNVPAHLAGQPLTMRRRQRTNTDIAPIVLLADCASSARIDTPTLYKRAALLLALVRIVSQQRPVELYAGLCANADHHRKNAGWYFAKIDTSPLDVGRAAFALGDPAFTRGIGYVAARVHTGDDQAARVWAYGRGGVLEPKEIEIVAANMFPGRKVVGIPALVSENSRDVVEPEKWLAETLQQIKETEQ